MLNRKKKYLLQQMSQNSNWVFQNVDDKGNIQQQMFFK